MPERVVFDTNVWVSGLLWRGKPYQCLLLARANIVQVVYCSPMLAELSEKLRHKFRFSENRIHAALYDIRRIGEEITISGDLHVVPDDPEDDKFIECALVAGATLVVSSDRHLLSLGEYQAIQVISPAALVSRFASFD